MYHRFDGIFDWKRSWSTVQGPIKTFWHLTHISLTSIRRCILILHFWKSSRYSEAGMALISDYTALARSWILEEGSPVRADLIFGKRQKSHRAKSGEYGGCSNKRMPLSSRYVCVMRVSSSSSSSSSLFISLFVTANFTGHSRLLGEETSRNHQADDDDDDVHVYLCLYKLRQPLWQALWGATLSWCNWIRDRHRVRVFNWICRRTFGKAEFV